MLAASKQNGYLRILTYACFKFQFENKETLGLDDWINYEKKRWTNIRDLFELVSILFTIIITTFS